ncbi:MAG: hypothetical protein HYS13_17695 [Planctomycetia bacterium]|nr:hypothetical protein [Planctomycetia bacterium]
MSTTRPISKRPNRAIEISTYDDLDRFLRRFADGHFNLLMIIGRPGLQKSRAVRAVVPEDAVCWIEGNATAFGAYQKIFEHRHKPIIVVDDVDSLYADRSAVRLLKCLCQTEHLKRLAWHSNAAALDTLGIPREFTTAARVAIIANQWKTLNPNVAALEDRGHLLFFNPSPLEVHTRTAEWFWDQKVFDFFSAHLHLIPDISMRHYFRAAELKRAGLNWKHLVLQQFLPDHNTLLVAQLKLDPTYQTEQQRVEAFKAKTRCCRATYFNHSRRLAPQIPVAPIRLTSPPPASRLDWSQFLKALPNSRPRAQTG